MNSAKHIADRIRLMIATKQFQVGEQLPSTRELGRQLEASFHTVRKAYGILVDEGLIRSEQGSGFRVYQQSMNLKKSERLEIGSEKLRILLEELIGYGLDEQEVEEIFYEQLNYLEWPDRIQECVTLGDTEEMAEILAAGIRGEVGVKSKTLQTTKLTPPVSYDAVFVPVHLYHKIARQTNVRELIPIIYDLHPNLILGILDHSALETLGLITTENDTISHLVKLLKERLQFEGSFLAGTTSGKTLPHLVNRADLILYTPGATRMVAKKIPDKKRLKIEFAISGKSAEIIRSKLWDQ